MILDPQVKPFYENRAEDICLALKVAAYQGWHEIDLLIYGGKRRYRMNRLCFLPADVAHLRNLIHQGFIRRELGLPAPGWLGGAGCMGEEAQFRFFMGWHADWEPTYDTESYLSARMSATSLTLFVRTLDLTNYMFRLNLTDARRFLDRMETALAWVSEGREGYP